MKKLIILIFFIPLISNAKEIGDGLYAMKTGILSSILAKEVCSCVYVSGLKKNDCIARSNLSSAALSLSKISQRKSDHSIIVAAGTGPVTIARYNPEQPQFGCRIIRGPLGQ